MGDILAAHEGKSELRILWEEFQSRGLRPPLTLPTSVVTETERILTLPPIVHYGAQKVAYLAHDSVKRFITVWGNGIVFTTPEDDDSAADTWSAPEVAGAFTAAAAAHPISSGLTVEGP